jgi:hypothetical protein
MERQGGFRRRVTGNLVWMLALALLLSASVAPPAQVRAQSINGPWTFTPMQNPYSNKGGSVNWYAQYKPYLSTPTRGCFKLVFTPPPTPPGMTPRPSTLYVPATTGTDGYVGEEFMFFVEYVDSPYWGPYYRSVGSGIALDGAGENWGGFMMKAGTSMTITRVNSIPNKPQFACTEGFSGVDLSTLLSISRSTQPVGSQFTTTVFVGNQGSAAASNVRVNVTLGSGLVIDAASPGLGTYSSGVWSIPSLASGQDAALNLTLRVASGTPGTTLGINASASSATADLDTANNSKQYSVMIGKPGPTGGAPKTGDPCPRGSRSRSFTGQIDAEGQPVNNRWQRITRVPVAQITITWGGICFNADGSINTSVTKSSNYDVSVAPRNGWTAQKITTSPSCSITASLADCKHTIRLTPPVNETLNVNFDIGTWLHQFGARFGISYSGTSSTREATLPVGMLVYPRGETYAAGAGSQPLPGTVGDY